MKGIDLLRLQADQAYRELADMLREIDEGQSWALISQEGAGQIALLHAALPAASAPPPSHADAIRRYLQDHASY